MNIIDVNAFKSDNISMNAKLIRTNSYNIEILYNNSSFMIQTPICTIEKINRNDKHEIKSIELSFNIQSNFNYFKFFNIFDLKLKKFATTVNENHNIIRGKTIDSVYNPGQSEFETESAINLCIQCKVNQETKYFDKHKKKISVYDLQEQDKIVGLITTRGIFMDSKAINYRWTGCQLLKF